MGVWMQIPMGMHDEDRKEGDFTAECSRVEATIEMEVDYCS